MTQPLSVFDVARYIVDQAGPMTVMKLQKLCYYSQAWSLVWDEAPLFKEEIQAWVNGPVIPDLYRAHKGLYDIASDTLPEFLTSANPERLDDNQKDTVNHVIQHYGRYNPQQLSTLTHRENPWIEAREGLNPMERGQRPISHESICEYYSGL